MSRTILDRPDEHFAYIARTDKPNDRLGIFVHGFGGGYTSTWGRLSDLLYTLDDRDRDFGEWDYAFVGYDTGIITTYLDISARVWTEWDHARAGDPPYKNKYNKFALFGHSLGTLGIRQFLCKHLLDSKDLAKEINSVTLFGTPLNGSKLADLAFWSKVADALEENNPQLRMLKAWSDSAHTKVTWVPTSVVLGLDDKVVGGRWAELVQWRGDTGVFTENFDHRDLVKPDCWTNSKVIDYIRRGLR